MRRMPTRCSPSRARYSTRSWRTSAGRGHDPIDRTALLDGVHQTLADEAALQADDAEADFRKPEPGASRSEGARPEPDTVHRKDPKTRWGEHPRRLIVRRDARRGRPKKKHGSDPPGR